MSTPDCSKCIAVECRMEVSLRHASVVRNSWASVTYDISIVQWWRDSDPFPRFRIDLNRDPITVAARLILRKKLDGLPLGGDGFNQVFIKLAFGQHFHVQLWDPTAKRRSKIRPHEIGSIDRLFQIHTEVKHIDQITHCVLVQRRTGAAGT